MKNKKVLMLLAITVVLSSAMTACNFGGGKDDSTVVQVTPTPEPTKAATPTPTQAPADAQNTTYTSKNKAVSIKLPDATWENKSDSDDMVSFESPKQGKLLILHGSGDEAMSVAIIPSSQDTAVALEKADNLEEGTDFEIQDYKAEEVSGINVYSYTVHYLNDKSEYAYVVNKYITDNTSEFYSVAGSVKTDDALAKVKTSVDSFKISGDSVLKAAATGKTSTTGTSSDGTTTDTTGTTDVSGTTDASGSSDITGTAGSDGTSSDSSSLGNSDTSNSDSSDGSYSGDSSYSGSSDGDYSYDSSSDNSYSADGSYDYDDGSSNGYFADGTPVGTDDPDYDTDQTRTIYRNSDGYPLVIYPNGDGTWYDDDGNTYDFANGEDVYDENGVDYYYHGEPAYVRYMPKNQD